MARNFQTNLILGGDSTRGVRAMRTVQGELDRTGQRSRRLNSQFQRQNQIAGQLTRTFRTLGVTLVGAFSVGAAVRSFSRLADEADRIGKTASRIDIAVESLQELRGAGELTGVAVAQIDESLSRFNRRLGLFVQSGSGPAAQALDDLGISVTDVRGRFIGTEAALERVADRIAALPTVAQQAAAASQLFGDEAGPKLVNLLSQGSAGIADLRAQIRRTGSVMSEEATRQAADYADQMFLLGKQFEGVRNEIGLELLPTISALLGSFNDLRVRSENTDQAVGELAGTTGDAEGAFLGAAEGAVKFGAGLVSIGRFAAAAIESLDQLATRSNAFSGLTDSVQDLKEGNILDGLFGPGSSEFFAGDGLNDALRNRQFGEVFGRVLGFRQATEAEVEAQAKLAGDLANVWDEAFDDVLSTFDNARELIDRAGERLNQPRSIRTFLDDNRGALIDFQGAVSDFENQAVRDLQRVRAAFSDTASATDEAGESIGDLEDANDSAFKGLQSLVKEFERSEEAAREFALENDLLAAQLGGPAELAAFEYAQSVREAMAVLENGDTTVGEFRERVRLLREELELSQSSAGAFGSAFSQIGANFSQAVLNGQGVQSAIGSSLLSFGGQGISEALDATDMAGFFETAFKDGIGAAFEDSEFQRNSAAGYALALSQAVDGNLGQAAFTALGNAIGGEIGALIGSIVGDALFGDSVSKFQVRGGRSNYGHGRGHRQDNRHGVRRRSGNCFPGHRGPGKAPDRARLFRIPERAFRRGTRPGAAVRDRQRYLRIRHFQPVRPRRYRGPARTAVRRHSRHL